MSSNESDAKQDEPQPKKQARNGAHANGNGYFPERESRSFKEIMKALDADGQFNDTSGDEFKTGLKLNSASKNRRNFVKNQAISLLLAGLSPQFVCDLLQIPASTVSTWRANLTPETIALIEAAEIKAVTNRIAQSVSTSLAAIERVALYMSEREYVQKNDPEKMVKAFDALSTFSLRLIEAHQRSQMARKQVVSEAGYTFTDESQTTIVKDETKSDEN